MRSVDEPSVDHVIREIAGLLAAAYARHSKIGLVPVECDTSDVLANGGETSAHGLTLTRQREESQDQ